MPRSRTSAFGRRTKKSRAQSTAAALAPTLSDAATTAATWPDAVSSERAAEIAPAPHPTTPRPLAAKGGRATEPPAVASPDADASPAPAAAASRSKCASPEAPTSPEALTSDLKTRLLERKHAEKELKEASTPFLFFPISIERLAKAIEDAKEVGVDEALIAEGSDKLEREAAAADEKKRNEIAGERRMGDPKAKRLKGDERVEESEEEVATKQLKKAIDPGWFIPRDPEKMADAIEKAKAAGVDGASIADAEHKLLTEQIRRTPKSTPWGTPWGTPKATPAGSPSCTRPEPKPVLKGAESVAKPIAEAAEAGVETAVEAPVEAPIEAPVQTAVVEAVVEAVVKAVVKATPTEAPSFNASSNSNLPPLTSPEAAPRVVSDAPPTGGSSNYQFSPAAAEIVAGVEQWQQAAEALSFPFGTAIAEPTATATAAPKKSDVRAIVKGGADIKNDVSPHPAEARVGDERAKAMADAERLAAEAAEAAESRTAVGSANVAEEQQRGEFVGSAKEAEEELRHAMRRGWFLPGAAKLEEEIGLRTEVEAKLKTAREAKAAAREALRCAKEEAAARSKALAEEDATAQAQAAERMEQGHAANRSHLYTAARERFLAADDRWPCVEAKISAANMALKLGDAEMALGEYRALLGEATAGKTGRGGLQFLNPRSPTRQGGSLLPSHRHHIEGKMTEAMAMLEAETAKKQLEAQLAEEESKRAEEAERAAENATLEVAFSPQPPMEHSSPTPTKTQAFPVDECEAADAAEAAELFPQGAKAEAAHTKELAQPLAVESREKEPRHQKPQPKGYFGPRQPSVWSLAGTPPPRAHRSATKPPVWAGPLAKLCGACAAPKPQSKREAHAAKAPVTSA